MSSPLLKPRWLLGHVLVVAATIGFALLGVWQLSRHRQQQADNAVIEQQLAAPPLELDSLPAGWEGLDLRRVVVAGRYDYAAQLELRPRARNGRVGYDQVVPLVGPGGVILVNRGFVADADGSARLTPQWAGELLVEGTVRPSQGTSSLGPQNPASGPLETIARIDLDRLASQFGGALAPVYLDLVAETPDAGGLPTVPPTLPGPTSRPHLLYAIQWWAFAGIASVGWVVYLRRSIR